jgi:hypothetical protein
MIEALYGKLSSKGKILFFVAIGTSSLLLMDAIVLGPILSQMKVMDADIIAKTETIHRNIRILSFEDSIFQEHKKYETFLQRADQSEEEIMADHLKEIESLGQAQTVKVSNIQSGEMEENPLVRIYEINIEGEGSLTNVLSFMNLLEESKYLFKIQSYQLSPKSKDGSVMKYKMDIFRHLVIDQREENDDVVVGEYVNSRFEMEEPLDISPMAEKFMDEGADDFGSEDEFGEIPLDDGLEVMDDVSAEMLDDGLDK